MTSIKLKSANITRDVLVPYEFLDSYMPNARGEYVKVYLYLLKAVSSNLNFSVNTIADMFDYTENDIVRALKYWQKLGVIQLQFDSSENISEITLNQISKTGSATTNISSNTETTPVAPVSSDSPAQFNTISSIKSKKRTYSSDEISAFRAKPDVSEFLYMAEKYIGKPLSSTDVNTILFIYDELNFDADLIEYLLEYCVENNHRSMHYIEKVAINWAEEGISSVQEAQASTELFSKACYPVLKAFGLNGRNPAKVEKSMIIKWINTYGFSMDIILDACDRTMNSIHKPSFEYADSILSNWSKKGVKSFKDIEQLDLARAKKKKNATPKPASPSKNSFNNFDQRNMSEDSDSLEKMLLQRSNQTDSNQDE